jgi:hypothetical protein
MKQLILIALLAACRHSEDCFDMTQNGHALAEATPEASDDIEYAIKQCKRGDVDEDREQCAAKAPCVRVYFSCLRGNWEVCEAAVPLREAPREPQPSAEPTPVAPAPTNTGVPLVIPGVTPPRPVFDGSKTD